ncbi:MAG: hypothetical protein SVK08_00245 [Halobacteriota archaeon]|nr:hypothetical protein [Halobacteriota archaeon]
MDGKKAVIEGIECLLFPGERKIQSDPEYPHMYYGRHSEDDMSFPCTIEDPHGPMANFWGIILAKQEMPGGEITEVSSIGLEDGRTWEPWTYEDELDMMAHEIAHSLKKSEEFREKHIEMLLEAIFMRSYRKDELNIPDTVIKKANDFFFKNPRYRVLMGCGLDIGKECLVVEYDVYEKRLSTISIFSDGDEPPIAARRGPYNDEYDILYYYRHPEFMHRNGELTPPLYRKEMKRIREKILDGENSGLIMDKTGDVHIQWFKVKKYEKDYSE